MENAKKALNKLVSLFFLLLLTLKGITQQTTKADARLADSLIAKVYKSNFTIYVKKSQIDIAYIDYFKKINPDFCIANPNEPFNTSDLRKEGLCNYRMVFYGTSLKFKNLHIFIYQANYGGTSVEESCDIFESSNNKLLRVVTIDIPKSTKNIIKLKQDIKLKKYDVMGVLKDLK